MDTESNSSLEWRSRPTLHPGRAVVLRRCDAVCQGLGVGAVIAHHGLGATSRAAYWEAIVFACMAVITLGITLRYTWSLAQSSFLMRHLWTVLAAGAWLLAMAVITLVTGILTPGQWAANFWQGTVSASEILITAYGVTGAIKGLRAISSQGINPALLLVGSFVLLISLGTLGLMLPVSTVPGKSTTLMSALFTSTSACCVTGLVVVDTGVHWTRTGQVIIMALIQVGGLGIMTFGAFFAAIAGKSVALSEAATLRELLGSEGLNDIRRVVFAILGFTFVMEFTGAVLLMPLWAQAPFSERLFQGTFHSISAFCNAGFATTPNSFVGQAHQWPVWGVITSLIILGGTGFITLRNGLLVGITAVRRFAGMWLKGLVPNRERLSVTTRMVVTSTAVLLVAGTLCILLLERSHTRISLADAWFQSVTFRTAGFNTVELSEWHPATKLVAILLMIVGASPGSTGGGVKTTVFAVAVVASISVIRGRDRVTAGGRTIPAVTVSRALTILLAYSGCLILTTLLVVVFENRPAAFLDHAFEAASALGTVGVTSGVEIAPGEMVATTKTLGLASQIVIVLAMFLGRVGPLTLMLALAGDPPAVRYEYPPERVTLG